MPRARIIVSSVTDEGHHVIVRGTLRADSPRTASFVFSTKGEGRDVELAERASRLSAGTAVVIEYTPVTEELHLARDLAPPP